LGRKKKFTKEGFHFFKFLFNLLFIIIFVEAQKRKDLQHFWAESFKSSFFF